MLRSRSILIVLSLLLVAANAPELEGRWYGGVTVFNGYETLIVDFENPLSVLEFKGNTAMLKIRDRGAKQWSCAVDEKLKTIDLTISEGPDSGKKNLGIYRFERDAANDEILKVCYGLPGDPRPTHFTYEPAKGVICHSFRRMSGR